MPKVLPTNFPLFHKIMLDLVFVTFQYPLTQISQTDERLSELLVEVGKMVELQYEFISINNELYINLGLFGKYNMVTIGKNMIINGNNITRV